MKGWNWKKAGKITSVVLTYFFLSVCLVTLMILLFGKKDTDGTSELFGYQMRVVVSPSMESCDATDISKFQIKSIPKNSMVFIETVPDSASVADEWYSRLRVGDVLTFRYVYTSQVTITHRITSIKAKEGGGYLIDLAGDNKNADSEKLYQTIDTSLEQSPNYVIGKVVYQSVLLGMFMSMLKSPLGLIFIVIIPCFIIILLEILKIWGIYSTKKRKQELDEIKKKELELEELRQRLSLLENQADNTSAEATAAPSEKNFCSSVGGGEINSLPEEDL